MGSPGEVKPNFDIVLFDGVCNLCSTSVQFIIKRDKKRIFQFASLQSEFGQHQLKKFNLESTQLLSIVLIRGDQFFQRSDAALEISKRLSAGWPLFYRLKIIPRFIRDGFYNWIAYNRYRFFGKMNSCWIPTAELKERFIE